MMNMKRTLFMVTAFICAVSLGFFEPVGAGIRVVSGQTSQDTYAIRNARIVTITGPVIENGTVVISNGRIAAVGSNVTVPAGARIIDVRGLTVYPGMVDGDHVIDVTEIGTVS